MFQKNLRETAFFVRSAYCVLRAEPFILSEDEGLTRFFIHHEGHREPRRKNDNQFLLKLRVSSW